MSRDLHELPRFADRWSYLYLEHGRLERNEHGLLFLDADGGRLQVPLDQFALVMLGPGTAVTQAAVRLLADSNTLLVWSGEHGVRLYAHSTGGTHSARRLLRQAEAWADPAKRLEVIFRLYEHRFPERLPPETTLEQVRGREGHRVRECYREHSKRYGVEWKGRSYDPGAWTNADPVNRALSAANSCLYGVCHAAILSAGYSPAIGFIHTGKQLSFVYDVADLYKTDLTIPVAFQVAAEGARDVERRVRMRCRDIFHEQRLLRRLLPDISEVLGVGDDFGESTDEAAGRIISLADRAQVGDLPGESHRSDSRPAMGEGNSGSG